jgi:glycerophosphoryl diester phosphodiesterase
MKKVISLSIVAVFAFITVFTVVGCSQKNSESEKEYGLFFGHRGFPAKHFENTLESFEAAGQESSYKGIETDVWRTIDGHFIVVHDSNPFVETDKSVPEVTLQDVQKYTLHASTNYPWFHSGTQHAPTFEQYLDVCKKYGKVALIEVKQPNFTKDDLSKLFDIVKAKNMQDDVIFISFNDSEINILREILPKNIEVMQLVDVSSGTTNHDVMWYINNGIAVDVGDPLSDFSWPWSAEITQEMIDKSHEKGLKFGVWGPDTAQRADELKNMKVDYITTDFIKSDSTGFKKIHNEVDGKYFIDDKLDKKEEPKK